MKNAFFAAILGLLAARDMAIADEVENLPGVVLTSTAFPTSVMPAVCPCDQPDEPHSWINAEYLLWWVRRSPLPVPVATLGDVSDKVPGALDQPGTRVLLGNTGLGFGAFT